MGNSREYTDFPIDGIRYGPGRVLIIAELGTSHGADLVKAGELIAAAAEAGADAIKTQMVYAAEILHPNTGLVSLPGGDIRLYDRFTALEAPLEFYARLKEEVERRGLLFLCTPFGPRSLQDLLRLQPRLLKIASPELNYTRLLRGAAQTGLPVLLSTGVSRLGDIEEALDLLRPGGKGPPVCLLHCVTSYPAPETDYNLRLLPLLRDLFGLPVGVSDHSLDPELVPALGTFCGAWVIEKHFCLSREDPGLDDPIALPPRAFARMVRAVRRAERGGTPLVEAPPDLVERILGTGIKSLAPSERANYRRTNRSVHALRDILPGEPIRPEAIASLRTEKHLRPGLPPSFEELLPGRKARQFIPAGEGIRWEDIG